MAEYQAPMAEKLRKSVGNVTYYIMHGKNIRPGESRTRKKRENPETTSSSSNLHDARTISTGTNRNDSNRFP